MPKTTKSDKVIQDELPSTLQRSDAKAQRTFAKAHDSAAEQYGDEERAHRVAFSALKHTHEKVGDHWEPKQRKGPSDPRAARGGEAAHRGAGASYGGVDEKGHTREELYERARQLGVAGRARMNKGELAQAIGKKQK